MSGLIIKVKEWFKPLEFIDLYIIILSILTIWFLLEWMI